MTTVDLKISSSSFKALYLSSMGLMGVAAALEEGVPTAADATLLGVAFCPAGVKGVPCPPVMEGGGGFALGVLSKLAFACTGVVVKALDDDHGSVILVVLMLLILFTANTELLAKELVVFVLLNKLAKKFSPNCTLELGNSSSFSESLSSSGSDSGSRNGFLFLCPDDICDKLGMDGLDNLGASPLG